MKKIEKVQGQTPPLSALGPDSPHHTVPWEINEHVMLIALKFVTRIAECAIHAALVDEQPQHHLHNSGRGSGTDRGQQRTERDERSREPRRHVCGSSVLCSNDESWKERYRICVFPDERFANEESCCRLHFGSQGHANSSHNQFVSDLSEGSPGLEVQPRSRGGLGISKEVLNVAIYLVCMYPY